MVSKINMKMNFSNVLLVIALGLFLLILFYSNGKEGYENEDDKLTDSILQSSEPVLVLFYAKWCGHCTKMKPDWEKACAKANAEQKRMFKINVGEDNKEHKEIMKKYDIEGFPTLIVFQNGSHTHYDGPRTVDKLLENLSLS